MLLSLLGSTLLGLDTRVLSNSIEFEEAADRLRIVQSKIRVAAYDHIHKSETIAVCIPAQTIDLQFTSTVLSHFEMISN